jgi:hypothetical protein
MVTAQVYLPYKVSKPLFLPEEKLPKKKKKGNFLAR